MKRNITKQLVYWATFIWLAASFLTVVCELDCPASLILPVKVLAILSAGLSCLAIRYAALNRKMPDSFYEEYNDEFTD